MSTLQHYSGHIGVCSDMEEALQVMPLLRATILPRNATSPISTEALDVCVCVKRVRTGMAART